MPDYQLTQIEGSPNWYVTWTVGRRSNRVSTRTSDRKKAELFLAEFRLNYRPEAEGAWTLPTVLDWYFDTHAKDLESAADAKASILRLTAFFGSSAPEAISPEQQKLFINERQAGGLSNETVNRDLSVLSAALNRAFGHKKIGQPFKIYLLPRAEPRERFLEREELARIYRQMRKQIRDTKRYHHVLLYTRIAINTGARPGAILDLTWDRVNFVTRTIWFPVPGKRVTKKRRTIISFDHKLESALRRAFARRRTEHVIEFEAQPVKQIRKSVVKSALAAGVEGVSPYTLRHTFGTWASGGGAALTNIGGAMGHTNPSTTAKYAKYQPGRFREVLRASRRKIR